MPMCCIPSLTTSQKAAAAAVNVQMHAYNLNPCIRRYNSAIASMLHDHAEHAEQMPWMNNLHVNTQALLVVSHEPMSCLAQRLLSSIEEEDDWGSQAHVSIGNEGPGSLQHHSHRCCAIRCTCQNSLELHTTPVFLLPAGLQD